MMWYLSLPVQGARNELEALFCRLFILVLIRWILEDRHLFDVTHVYFKEEAMTLPRNNQIDLTVTPYYHLMCRDDPLTNGFLIIEETG